MAGKAVISLSTGLEDPEKVTVAFLVAVGAPYIVINCSYLIEKQLVRNLSLTQDISYYH